MPDLSTRQLRFEVRELLLVALGAIPGALLRWFCSVQLAPRLGGSAGSDFFVNVLGSFALGFLAGPIPRRTTLFPLLGIGFCGCLTTFSSWMLDVVRLLEQERLVLAVLLLLVSLILGLAFAVLGLGLSRRLFRRSVRRS